MSAPDVLTDAKTEPEAAHLRNVLRQIVVILDTERSGDLERVVALARVRDVVQLALERPMTNGAVIDALAKENGDLQSQILDLQQRIRQYRDTMIAKGQVGQ
jgi:hypothetical protein